MTHDELVEKIHELFIAKDVAKHSEGAPYLEKKALWMDFKLKEKELRTYVNLIKLNKQ